MRMNKLAFTRRFTFAVLSLLITANLWGQAALSGSGTEESPYQITSVADWNAFAAAVNGGYDYSGKYVQLEADVPSEEEIYAGTPALTTMVGVWDATEGNRKPFKGTFRGNGKTIIVSYTSDGNYTAPFRCTNGATITNDFTIVGNINATNGYAAGVVGGNYGNKTKINSNVTVSVNITGGGTYCGGIAVDATKLEVSSCTYNGKIVAGDYSAGFCATGGSETKFNKCIFAPEEESSITGEHTENFMNGSYDYSSNFYYTYFETPVVSSSTQGTCIYESYNDIPDDGKFRMSISLAGHEYYYVEGTAAISGLATRYYQNNAQSGGITYEVKFNLPGDDPAVLDAECYIADVLDGSDNPVDVGTIAPGTYTLRITGKEDYCSGTLTSESFTIVETLFPNGTGTESNPYQIHDITDWKTFAKAVNEGHSFLGEYLKLTDNIIVTVKNIGTDTIVGTMTSNGVEDKWFSGTFDGDWHTITFNVGAPGKAITPEHNNSPSAPFRVIDGATIKNLTVDGTIYSTKKYNSGFVGFAYNTQTSNVNNIINCTSSIKFYGTSINNTGASGDRVYDCSAGGFVAENKDGNIYFNNCIFNGEINKGDQSSANRGAGFVSYNNGSKLYFTNCTMAGTIGLDKAGTFYRGKDAKHAYSNCYYATRPTNQDQEQIDANCKEAYTDATIGGLSNEIYKKYVINSTNYYIPSAVIAGFETTTYSYVEGQTTTIDAPVVSYYGRTLTRGTDYVIKKKYGEGAWAQVDGDITLSEAGEYKIKIEAKEGSSYGGSQTTTIKVVEFNSWAVLKEYLADDSKGDRVITLSSNITSPNPKSDSALVVKGNVILNLNNKTINRNLSDTVIYGQVIRVKQDANLTINGPGIIKGGYNWPGEGVVPKETTYWPKRDGGGIHNMGNLVLNNVDVIYNKCYKEEDGSTNPTARGGGIYSGSGSSLIINGGRVSNNIGRGGGGGVYCDKANPFVMTGVEVWANESDSKGGGLRIKTGSAVAYLTDCDISFGNKVLGDASQGGGVYLEGGELVMESCQIAGNQSTMQGAGFYSKSGKTTAINCDIYYNGTMYYTALNHGGGICLNDNKGSDHSIYIMDGGSIYENNTKNNGGGIYVYDGAVFQVKGNVQIYDNVQAAMGPGLIGDNNAYLDGSAVIEVIGPLGEDAIINITPHDGGGVSVEFADGASSGIPADDLSHFTLDGSDYNLIIDKDGNIESYVPSAWNNTDTWNGTVAEATDLSGGIPTSSSVITIHRAVKIPSGVTANAGTINCDAFCDIILEDGAQLLTNSSGVAVLAKKEIKAATTKNDATGWYLISSPAANPNIVSATNLITTGSQKYDLYRYNEAADLQWENYRAGHADFTTLENGRGYLYRNKNDYTLNIGGTLHVSDVSCDLSYHATTSPSGNVNTLIGFNIIGNPYSHTIYKGVETEDVHPAIPNGTLLEGKYYVLDAETGKWAITDDGTAIPPMTGILVQAKSAGTLTMKNSTEGKVVPESKNSRANGADRKNIWFTVANSNYEDRTCVEFREGHGLNKIAHENENIQMLYIHHNGEDFASVDMNPEAKMFNLNFEAKTMGYYTLSVEPQGEYSYLHLIDKVTEKEIDLLEENEYTFIGSTSDAANRFIVRMSLAEDPEESDNEVFAYQSGDEIVVTGEGELQVFDVMGRFVATYNVSGVQTVTKPITAGVYIVKLNEKTQKIIIK